MKFLRFLCNALLYFATVLLLCVIQVGIYDLFAVQDNFGLQSEDGSSVEIVTVIPNDNQVMFIDSYTFWGTDIAAGVDCPAKYRIRSWGEGWWSENMGWADVALDSVIAVFKPIFVPIAQVNALKEYYLTDNYTVNTVYSYSNVSATDLYEAYVLFSDFTYDYYNRSEAPILDYLEYGGVKIAEYDYASEAAKSDNDTFFQVNSSGEYYYDGTKIGDLAALKEYCADESNYINWVKKNDECYNIDWKLHKYNSEVYDRYFTKFIHSYTQVENGVTIEVRSIKSSVVVLYFIQTTSLIVALIFVIKYPVSLLQLKYEDGKRRRKEKKSSSKA